ncbi:MAG: zinc-dependent metalloproteinase lipoprotein family [Crocinitomicaceae bacterium]|jgi:hypothetical protein|nr:zinc-dependent metalloproteinase lipoprotein family [Crocinitomicaceae bacterium]
MRFLTAFAFISLCSLSFSQQPEENMTKDGYLIRVKGGLKTVRINIHFMLKSDGTGNFNEKNDGNGRPYSGYDYARDLVYYMNAQSIQNVQLNIPEGNEIPVLEKNYRYVLDAVYFWRNDSTYLYNTINYAKQGRDKDSVMNIFLSHGTANLGGHASSVSTVSHYKYTENRSYWFSYSGNKAKGSADGDLWTQALNTSHEVGHLLGLNHTVLQPNGSPCPGGCKGGTINANCDDGCADTPSAWEILDANGCTTHPGCGWSGGITGKIDCSNNLMDYTGMFALSPCQIEKIHRGLENGLKSYLQCAALSDDVSFKNIGYPKVSYFGRNVQIVDSRIEYKEKIKIYYSSSVELNNFEAEAGTELEIILDNECSF